MDAIGQNLSDPSWWFSAFFVATVASVLAGFLKDRLERYFSRISDTFRRRRVAALKLRTEAIEALAENPTYLSFAFQVATWKLLLWVTSILLFVGTVLLFYVAQSEDSSTSFRQRNVAYGALEGLLFVTSLYFGFRTAVAIRDVSEALRQFRRREGLPKLP